MYALHVLLADCFCLLLSMQIIVMVHMLAARWRSQSLHYIPLFLFKIENVHERLRVQTRISDVRYC